MAIKYTDVDYYVFTDAAKLITEVKSPYLRPTYRYTPLLAMLLVPNVTLWYHFGKLLFVLSDVFVGLLLYYSVRHGSGGDKQTSLRACQLWLYNPLVAGVSTRGNAESLISTFVLLSYYFLLRFKKGSGSVSAGNMLHLVLSAVFYGLSVHLKMFPVIYCLPIYLYLYQGPPHHGFIRKLLNINLARVIFVSVSVFTFVSITYACYLRYGYEFVYETYLYHVVRKDVRHNFSAHFLSLYLSAHKNSLVIGLMSFVPQAVLMVALSLRYHAQLGFCWFLQTFTFVCFNKVCTSQYFLWYISLLPLVVPNMRTMKRTTALLMLMAWIAGQVLWLIPAFYFEFHGLDTFVYMWIASLIFMSINTSIICVLIYNYV